MTTTVTVRDDMIDCFTTCDQPTLAECLAGARFDRDLMLTQGREHADIPPWMTWDEALDHVEREIETLEEAVEATWEEV